MRDGFHLYVYGVYQDLPLFLGRNIAGLPLESAVPYAGCWVLRPKRPPTSQQCSGRRRRLPYFRFLSVAHVRLWCRVCRMSGWHVAAALALRAPEIAWPIFVVLMLEWVVWPVVMPFLPDVPRCPICQSSFQWTEIDTGGSRSRPLSFPCPKCLQTIGAPSWRKSFLRAFYLSLIAIFMFLLFDLRGDLFLGYLGILGAGVGAVRIADWFVLKRLEPGSYQETDNSSLFS
jgi:hypothetical protein